MTSVEVPRAELNYTFSVIKSRSWDEEKVVATGLDYNTAKTTAKRLDDEYEQKLKVAGKHYSSWTAELHFPRREEACSVATKAPIYRHFKG